MSGNLKKPLKTKNRLKNRNTKVILGSLAGESNLEISKKMGIGPERVGNILNYSEEAYAVAAFIEKELEEMVGLALQVVKSAMQKDQEKPENALKAALAVLDRIHLRSIEKEKTQLDEWMAKIKDATPRELITLMDQAKQVMQATLETYERQISGTAVSEERADPGSTESE